MSVCNAWVEKAHGCLSHQAVHIQEGATWFGHKVKELGSRAGASVSAAAKNCGSFLKETFTPVGQWILQLAQKTASFIKANWKQLIAYLIAWGLMISCMGLMYGFEAVALPLTIGMLWGSLFGAVVAILTINVFDPEDKYRGRNTLWEVINSWIESLDSNGTRQILFTIAFAVLFTAAQLFSYHTGGVLGVILGNYLVMALWRQRDLSQYPPTPSSTPSSSPPSSPSTPRSHDVEVLERRILALEQQLQQRI